MSATRYVVGCAPSSDRDLPCSRPDRGRSFVRCLPPQRTTTGHWVMTSTERSAGSCDWSELEERYEPGRSRCARAHCALAGRGELLAATDLPVHPVLQRLYRNGNRAIRIRPRGVAGASPPRALSPVAPWRARSSAASRFRPGPGISDVGLASSCAFRPARTGCQVPSDRSTRIANAQRRVRPPGRLGGD